MESLILLETVYMICIVFMSFTIFLQARKLYSFSRYKGLSYFSLAFLFLAIGFLARYFVMFLKLINGNMSTIQSFDIFTLIMEFFIIVPGLFLAYSQVWQRFEKDHYAPGITTHIFIYLIAFSIALTDFLIEAFYSMYLSQIMLFFIASVLSYRKYVRNRNNYSQLYFISMVLFFILWVINMIAQYTINIVPIIRLYTYLLTVSVCFILFYITVSLTRGFR